MIKYFIYKNDAWSQVEPVNVSYAELEKSGVEKVKIVFFKKKGKKDMPTD